MSDKPTFGSFCWNELMTHNTAEAKRFYQALFGWESYDMPMADGMTYTIFKKGDADLAGLLQTPQGQEGIIPPHWMSYVNVEDIEASAAKAESLGASLKAPIQTIEGIGKFAIVMDPTGAHFAFWQSL